MGQARKRGSFDERKKEAVEKQQKVEEQRKAIIEAIKAEQQRIFDGQMKRWEEAGSDPATKPIHPDEYRKARQANAVPFTVPSTYRIDSIPSNVGDRQKVSGL